MGEWRLKVGLPCEEEHTEAVRHGLANWLQGLGFSELMAYRVTTVMDELFCNTMEHSGANWVEITARRRGEAVVLHFEDDGVAFDPWLAGAKDYSDYLRSDTDRHLGLFLVNRLAREAFYERRDGKNRVSFIVGRDLPDPLELLPEGTAGKARARNLRKKRGA
jgi:anti-sigma regulatory factor (Ser/Thr protein kinase)